MVHLLWPHGSSGGRTCTSVLFEIVYVVEIYSGTFHRDFTMRGIFQPIPGSSIEHVGCERLTGQRKVVIMSYDRLLLLEYPYGRVLIKS